MIGTPSVAIVIATMNRRDVVLFTLARLHQPNRIPGDHEIVVCVNPSSDNTVEAIRERFPDVRVISLDRNLGSCAKAVGVAETRSEYVLFLDDDSHPWPDAIARMFEKFQADSRLGAAAFTVHLPDGRQECSALPGVFVGCGVGFRRAALDAVGGLDSSFFMQAEEYDLSFRLVAGGWKVKTFTDLGVDHLKTPTARLSGRTVRYDTRNNRIVIARYLPDEYEEVYRQDWMQRYRWIGEATGHLWDYWKGRLAGALRAGHDRQTYARWRLSPAAFESLFHVKRIASEMQRLAGSGARRIILADLGKNIYPFVRGARSAGLEILCIADDRFARLGRRYRGVPVVETAEALTMKGDAVVISNASAVHAENRHHALENATDLPIHRWFGYDRPSPDEA
ncbi:MAG: glycosyltransferase [Phycisphaerae bacterium]